MFRIPTDLIPVAGASIFIGALIGIWFVVRHINEKIWFVIASAVCMFIFISLQRLFANIFDAVAESGVKGTSHQTLDNLMALPFALGAMYFISVVFKSLKGDRNW